MDEQGNLYDMEGHFVGKVDEGAEEGEEEPEAEGQYYGEEGASEGNDGNPPEMAHHEALPEIPAFNQRKHHQQHDSKKKPLM